MPQDHFGSFTKADIKVWREAAEKELGGKDPFESLSISRGSIRIKPYYDKDDAQQLGENILPPSGDPYLGPRGWYNTPIVSEPDSVKANKIALAHLNEGADGVMFRLYTDSQVNKLLQNIELHYCSIFFLAENGQSDFLTDFEQHADAKGFDKTQIVGGVFWETLPKNYNDIAVQFAKWGKFRALGQIVSSSEECTGQIVDGLIKGTDILAQATDKGIDAREIYPQLAFSFQVGTDFFLEIAKLKGFRRLWRQIGNAYNLPNMDNSLLLHGLSTCWNKENYQPNANMLKSTTAALSAILGGCDAITVEPEDEGSQFKSRIARNVLTLLREESHLNQPSDATAGSYYLDSLIHQLAKASWAKFQGEVKR